jgi:hypothetical protein
VVHQISKRLVKWFKRYRDYKNPRWPPACGRHLEFVEKYKVAVLVLVGPKWYTKFQKDWSNGLKVIAIKKIQDGRRPAAANLDFLKNIKLWVLALVGLKWYTKFQKDWSNGLKVIAITKIQDGRRPAAAILDF